jgi:type IV pilus assembly protein PilW
MASHRHSNPCVPRQHGFGLVEIMVGLVIGLIAVLVIYQVYSVAEGFKRNTTAAGEAQMNGLFSTFVLGMELANAGSSMAVSASELASCKDPTTYPATDTRHFAESLRPIPVAIYDSGNDAKPDFFVVNYSIASTLAGTAMFNVDAGPNAPYRVQSPGGFLGPKAGFKAGDLIIGISNPGGSNADCASSKVTGVSAVGSLWMNFFGDSNEVGDVTITHTGAPISFTGICGNNPGNGGASPGCTYKPGSTLFNMGPADRVQKIGYRLCDGTASCAQPPTCRPTQPCTLESFPLLDSNGQPLANPAPGNPLASNVINMKVEYGIDSDGDGLLDTWVQATAAATWDPANLLPALLPKINQVKAVRIGIIVMSEQFDKTLDGFTGGDYTNGDYNWVLFDCPAKVCPGRLTGTIPESVSPKGNWRFRKYETIIPLRNEIWNRQT